MAAPRSGPPGVVDRSAFVDRVVGLLRPLLNYARAELRAHEALGDLPPGAVAPEDIVDTALLAALRRADEAPDNRLYPWLRGFVRRAIAREVAAAHRRRARSLFDPIGIGRPEEEAS